MGQAKLHRHSSLTAAKTLSHNHETAKISDTTQHQVSNRDLNKEQYLMLVFVHIHILCLRELNTGREKTLLYEYILLKINCKHHIGDYSFGVSALLTNDHLLNKDMIEIKSKSTASTVR